MYEGKMDKEVIGLCDKLNSIPGIKTVESCSGHNKTSFNIWFKYDRPENDGLMLLVRSIDSRYWEYGNDWSITLSVSDIMEDDSRPVMYLISSGDVKGKEAYKQAKDLIDNIDHHINHESFRDTYNIHLNEIQDELPEEEDDKPEISKGDSQLDGDINEDENSDNREIIDISDDEIDKAAEKLALTTSYQSQVRFGFVKGAKFIKNKLK